MPAIIRTENVNRIYHLRGEDVHAVNDVSLEIPSGKLTAIVGRSGSGKTTFLNLISGLEMPDSGNIWFMETCLNQLDTRQREALRRDKMGFVFQSFGLLPLLSAQENVEVPLRMRRLPTDERRHLADSALQAVGLTKRADHRPHELSGGEQQRVAIARALASRPQVVLADEPTGQLDTRTGQAIIDLLRGLVAQHGISTVVVTHDPKVMRAADVVHELRDGRLWVG